MTLSDYIDEVNELPAKRVKEFIKELKGRNANQRRFLPEWKSLSKAELYKRLIETLDCFDNDINELAGEEILK